MSIFLDSTINISGCVIGMVTLASGSALIEKEKRKVVEKHFLISFHFEFSISRSRKIIRVENRVHAFFSDAVKMQRPLSFFHLLPCHPLSFGWSFCHSFLCRLASNDWSKAAKWALLLITSNCCLSNTGMIKTCRRLGSAVIFQKMV